MSLPLIHRNINQDHYARQLRTQYLHTLRLYDPDYALRNEADPYEKIRRDPKIAAAIDFRLHSIAGRKWIVAPKRDENELDKKAATIVEDMLKEIHKFTEARYEMAMAVILSRSFSYIEGRRVRRAYGEMPAQDWWVPTRLTDIDRRRVRYVSEVTQAADGTKTAERVMEMSVVANPGTTETGIHVVVQRPELLVKLIYHDEEARLGYGRGLLESLYFWSYTKSIFMRDGAQGVKRWARGLAVAKVAGAKDAGTDKPNTTIVDDWLDQLDIALAGGDSIVMDKDDELDVVFAPIAGSETVLKWVEKLDEDIIQLVTGSKRPMGENSGGAYAQAEVEAQSSESIIGYDRDLLAEAITRDLIGLMWRLNRAQFTRLGLNGAQMPTFEVVPGRIEDPEKVAGMVATLLGADVDLVAEDVYDRTGFSRPKPGDEIIKGSSVGADSPFGSPFGGGVPGMPAGQPPQPKLPQPGTPPRPAGIATPDGAIDSKVPTHETAPDGDVQAGQESIAAQGIEPPTMQEISLAYERAIKASDRATANIMRKKLWAITGEETAPDISDAEWAEMEGSSGGGGDITEDVPQMPKTVEVDE